jgi:hypothetical protein
MFSQFDNECNRAGDQQNAKDDRETASYPHQVRAALFSARFGRYINACSTRGKGRHIIALGKCPVLPARSFGG